MQLVTTQPGGLPWPKRFKKNGVGMRKLKGYIGALIVVMSLMGSILAGYALNINGTSAVINEYEKVTDVSGLYAHTDEKNYIEYNPASNYIGYTGKRAYENTVPSYGYTLKNITEGTIVITPSSQTITVNGVTHTGFPANYLQTPFICDKAFFEGGGTSISFVGPANIVTSITNTITITISNNTTTLLINNTTITLTDVYHNLVYWPYDGWDYIEISGARAGNGNAINAYLNSVNDVLSAGNDGTEYASAGTTKYYRSINTTGTLPLDTIPKTAIDGDVFQMNINYNLGGASAWGLYYPRYAYADTIGVDYDRSTRVNNYPFEYITNSTSETTTSTFDLTSFSGTDYYNYGKWIIGSADFYGPWYRTFGGTTYTINTANADLKVSSVTTHKIRLADLITNITYPVNTNLITFDTGFNDAQSIFSAGFWSNTNVMVPLSINTNLVTITTNAGDTSNLNMINLGYGWKAYYYPNTGLVDIYTTTGVKVSTGTLDSTYIQYSDTRSWSGVIDGQLKSSTMDYSGIDTNGTRYPNAGYYNTSDWGYNSAFTGATPSLTVSITTGGTIQEVRYMDITKGVATKPNTNVTWNNEYENGNIKLLFRAEDNTQTYSNTFTVSGNTVAINYTGQHYYVSLNGGEAVDIGMWRSIVLDVNLIDGRLTAIPVRTFNSFSNVQMDNTRINIGDLVNAVPSASIVWGSTSNSLRFGVYSTEVFMNTYGVVMVNPTLNITNYFTDLNNFYRLNIYNFSVLGDSITVNGVTGTVTGDNITFNDETVKLKEIKITYADGHAYIEDSHAVIDLGAIVNNVVSMEGVWYFQTDLLRGFTTNKMVYNWDWNGFIFDNVQFVVFYIGLAVAGLVIGRRYATMTVIDYVVWGISMIVAISVQVIG